MERPGEQQVGITNDIVRRLREHARDGWSLVEAIGPMSGRDALDRETAMRRTIKSQFEAVPGKRENWLTTSFDAASIAAVEGV
jgi:predicted GIY-YIG superfamily endonuclease